MLAGESDRLTELLGSEVQPVYLERASVTLLNDGDEDRDVDDSVNTRVLDPVSIRWVWTPYAEDPITVMREIWRGGIEARVIGHPPAPDGWDVLTKTTRVLVEVIEAWCDAAECALDEGREVPKLPGATLVRAWQERPVEVERSAHPFPLFPTLRPESVRIEVTEPQRGQTVRPSAQRP